MIAAKINAAVNTSAEMNLFKLVLLLNTVEKKPIPQTLIFYFDKVLEQVKLLISEPQNADEKIYPEAIELALKIKIKTCFRNDIIELKDYNSLTPKIACHILEEMEEVSA